MAKKNLRAPEESDYRGQPIITFFTGDEFEGKPVMVSMGYRKAKAIMDNVEYLYRFVASCEEKGGIRRE
jgi:hypothetical protein